MNMNPEKFRKECKGILPVQFCPMNEDKELDLEGLRENTRYLVDFKNDGDKDVIIMTNGSTTECYANSIEEQKSVIETVINTVDGELPVIAGVSHSGTRETIKMAKFAEEAGADCAMVVLPYYHGPTRRGMYKHYQKIADAVDIGIMIYNNPDVSGMLIPPDLMAELSKVENIVALKDNTPNAAEYAQKAALIEPEDMTLINGLGDLHYTGAAAYGLRYKGFVSSVANFAPSLAYAIYEAVSRSDFKKAEEAIEKVLPIYDTMADLMEKREYISIIPETLRVNYMYMSHGKAALDIVGLNGGPVRGPLTNVTEEEKEKIRETLQKVGVIE